MRVVFKSFNLTIASPFILMINTCVFIMWQFSSQRPTGFMSQNFLISWESLIDGRFWTLLTSAFSHNLFLHFFINMYVFWGFGRVVERVIGSSSFFKFYIYAGITSSLAHAFTSAFLMENPYLPALGASGSVAGIILLFSLMFPKEKILLLGIIPLPAIVGAFLFIGIDLWGLTAQMGGSDLPIGHGAHLGGAFFGLLYFLLKIRPQMKSPPRRSNPDIIDVDYERLS